MKVIHLSSSDSGGAGRAALRIHKSLLEIGVNSELWVDLSKTQEKNIISSTDSVKNFFTFVKRFSKILYTNFFFTKNPVLHSPAIFPSLLLKKINKSDAEIVNLHWVQHEMLSISDISKINKPIVWTLHDMWAFCGAEHIAWDNRWEIGYSKKNRPSHEKGFDLNKWTWFRKKKFWKKPIQIICPSNWLSECVKKSKLMKNWPCVTISNSIDTEFWKPESKNLARKKLEIFENSLIIAFGSSNALYEHHKGFDLLCKSLKNIKLKNNKTIQLIVFGQNKYKKKIEMNLPVKFLGYLDDKNLKTLYSAVDAVVVPSRQESFGQIAAEASACETPIIAFDTSGLKDIIIHKLTGYLAKSYDINDFTKGVEWVLQSKDINILGKNARQHIVDNFNKDVIAKKYLSIYRHKLEGLPFV